MFFLFEYTIECSGESLVYDLISFCNSDKYDPIVRLINNEDHTESIKSSSIKLYPNPVRDILYLQLNDSKNYSYKLFSSIGDQLDAKQISGNQLDFSSLEAGVYIISIYCENKILTNEKFIKL